MNFLLDENGDLAFENNNWVMVEGIDEIKQILKCNLQAIAGEWFLDTTIGLPYFTEIFEKQSDVSRINQIFLDAVRNSEGVLSVIRFETSITDKKNRAFEVSFEVETYSGILVFNEQIAPTAE